MFVLYHLWFDHTGCLRDWERDMGEWVVCFYVEPFPLYLNRDMGWHILSPLLWFWFRSRSLYQYQTRPSNHTITPRIESPFVEWTLEVSATASIFWTQKGGGHLYHRLQCGNRSQVLFAIRARCAIKYFWEITVKKLLKDVVDKNAGYYHFSALKSKVKGPT